MADEVVGDLAQVLGGEHGVGELVERLVVDRGDGLDQVVEADGVGHADGIDHGVNPKLSI